MNKRYFICQLINLYFLHVNQYIAPYIFTRVFYFYFLLVSPSRWEVGT
jgi:hypothetical protein